MHRRAKKSEIMTISPAVLFYVYFRYEGAIAQMAYSQFQFLREIDICVKPLKSVHIVNWRARLKFRLYTRVTTCNQIKVGHDG